ncbi:EF-hand calcium-binding domain-containing protein 1 [Holothuria leucospilota]|uniref:EF-hand calcium-binding domain-containing protein 1 n=1 Tax=Holothuria leucospilota TaxID=206669 RepID=A0A9Q1BE52_HOLLE|nr:EF-hand calcium-binding domain-containing protein 1 [Holothuria leucospilota]
MKDKKHPQMPVCQENYRNTHFTKEEYEALENMFKDLTKDNIQTKAGKLDRSQFRDVLHATFKMTDDMILDRVFRAFDEDSDSYINLSEWIHGLSIFLRGDLTERAKFCFDVYDLNGDSFISREEMFHLLKYSLMKQPTEEDPEEGTKELVEILLKKMDYDHDGRLNLTDYETAVKDDDLLIEAFGACLPEPQTAKTFLEYAFTVPKVRSRYH